MNDFKTKYGKTALVAGASEGLGAAWCHEMAAMGMDIVMLARRSAPLEETAQHIRSKYGVEVTTLACDLADPDIIRTIDDMLAGKAIDVLIYNAALSHIGPFMSADIESQIKIATVNMITPMRLLHHYGGAMVGRRKGAVIMMASIAGFQGSGFLAVYASTKAFDRVLAESLWYEWKHKGVDVIACCAGATATPNYLNTKPAKMSLLAPRVQAPEEVVAECMQKLGTVPSFVTGTGNKLATFMMKLMPRYISVKIMGDTARSMYGINE
jgi:short-subunit dehydrogenase